MQSSVVFVVGSPGLVRRGGDGGGRLCGIQRGGCGQRRWRCRSCCCFCWLGGDVRSIAGLLLSFTIPLLPAVPIWGRRYCAGRIGLGCGAVCRGIGADQETCGQNNGQQEADQQGRSSGYSYIGVLTRHSMIPFPRNRNHIVKNPQHPANHVPKTTLAANDTVA